MRGKPYGEETEAHWEAGLDGTLSLRVAAYDPDHGPDDVTRKTITLTEDR